MGLLNWLKKDRPSQTLPPADAQQTPALPSAAEAVMEIARIVSFGDPEVLREASLCAADIQGYYTAHEDFYADYGFDCADPRLQWFGLIGILENHQYLCERDWKDEKDDFVYFFSSLKGIGKLGLTVDPDWFDETKDILLWGTVLKEKWVAQQCAAAMFNIDSDSYVLFPCRMDDFSRLVPLGEALGGCFNIVADE